MDKEQTHGVITLRQFQDQDREQVILVWHESGLYHPDNDPSKDIDRKMRDSPEGFIVAEVDGKVVGTVMIGYDGHRGWINYLGVLPSFQSRGVGASLMNHSEMMLENIGCAKINLQVRTSNHHVIDFYKSLGYNTEDLLSMGKRLEFD